MFKAFNKPLARASAKTATTNTYKAAQKD